MKTQALLLGVLSAVIASLAVLAYFLSPQHALRCVRRDLIRRDPQGAMCRLDVREMGWGALISSEEVAARKRQELAEEKWVGLDFPKQLEARISDGSHGRRWSDVIISSSIVSVDYALFWLSNGDRVELSRHGIRWKVSRIRGVDPIVTIPAEFRKTSDDAR